MAKKVCSICGKRLGFLDSNLRFNDGIACADCCKKIGLSTLNMASINWAEKHSVEEVKMMLHVGQIIDPHQDNQIDKQLQKKTRKWKKHG